MEKIFQLEAAQPMEFAHIKPGNFCSMVCTRMKRKTPGHDGVSVW